MNIGNATLSLEPRSVGACIDLAVLFYQRHAAKLLSLSLLFGALPIAAGVFGAERGTGWLWSGLSFFFLSPFLGATVVAGVGYHVFGEELTISNALAHVSRRPFRLVLLLTAARLVYGFIAVLCWGLLSVPVAVRYGFLSEVLLLEQLRGTRIVKRVEEIHRRIFLEASGRFVAIVGFAVILSLTLFLLFDLGSQTLFGVPIFLSKVSWAVASADIVNLLSYDPLLIGSLSATLWLVYPFARLAWFFCYLDTRVRKEGWDVEIALRNEARRLQDAY